MKIIRRLEDFDGLENGKGLRLVFAQFNSHREIRVELNNRTIELFDVSEKPIKKELFEMLNAFGFDYKYKRTLNEILEENPADTFVYFRKNYSIWKDVNGIYKVFSSGFYELVGAIYYNDFEKAQAICDELNL